MKFKPTIGLGSALVAGLMGSVGQAQAAGSASEQAAVVLHFDGDWPRNLAIEVRKDLNASLGERGVLVVAEGDPAARATLHLSPPSVGEPRVLVRVVDPDRTVAADRELSLVREHPDTWSVAIAATADELLAATWSLPDVVPGDGVSPVAPVVLPASSLPPASSRPPARESRRGEVGLGGALEQYFPNAQVYGADLFGALVLTDRLQLELGVWFRDIASRRSASGDIYGTMVGGDVTISSVVTRGPWFGFDVFTGVHAGIVWLDGRARSDVTTRSVTGAMLSARVGGRASLFTSDRTRLGLAAAAGVPLITATASDAGREVLALRGAEVGARLEAGWQF